jgi:SanA protein
MRRFLRRMMLVLSLLLLAAAAAAVTADRTVVSAAAGRTFDSVGDVPSRKAALVLGTNKWIGSGRPNAYYTTRIETAAELYRSGKVRALIVSGDNATRSYNEPAQMKEDLVAAGVPAGRIYQDFAGFRTLDSVVRLKAIFGQDEALVVSQKFHNERAVFLAKAHGIDLVGVNTREIGGAAGIRNRAREILARVAAVLDVWVLGREPKFYGEKIGIEG